MRRRGRARPALLPAAAERRQHPAAVRSLRDTRGVETIVLISRNFDISIGSTAALCALIVISLAGPIGIPTAILLALVAGSLDRADERAPGRKGWGQLLHRYPGYADGGARTVIVITGGTLIRSAHKEVGDALAKLYYTVHTTPNLLPVVGLGLLAWTAWGWRTRAPQQRGSVLDAGTRGGGDPGTGRDDRQARSTASSFACSSRCGWRSPSPWRAWWVMQFTVVGRRIYAVGGNDEAARLSGIRVVRYRIAAFIAMGAASGLVGAIFATRLGSLNPTSLEGAGIHRAHGGHSWRHGLVRRPATCSNPSLERCSCSP